VKRRAAAGAIVLLLAACGGGGDGATGADPSASASGSGSGVDEETTTTEEPERSRPIAVPTSFRVDGQIDYGGFVSTVQGLVADPERYELVFEDDELHLRVVRVGGRVLSRSAADADAAGALPYQQGPAAEVTALGSLELEASFGPLPADPGFEPTGGELAIDALGELLVTDPVALLGDEVVPGETVELDVPRPVADALDALRVDPPQLEATADGDGEALTVSVDVLDGGPDLSIAATFTDIGGVSPEDIVPPSGDQIDPTPWLDEERLATFADTPLVAPTPPPPGFALGSVFVLEAFETAEGCPEVQLDYYEPEDPVDGHVVQLFLLDKECATSADPTEFDGTTGGLPSRYDGFELVLGSTVVQVFASQTQFDLDAFGASLAPTTVEALVASLVPLPG
jgi:hypothetical protein